MAYRILSLDGGGMRGLLSALVLERLAVDVPDLIERCDLLAGTSSGGLIALGLAYGYGPARLVELFESESAQIFRDSPLDDLVDLGRLLGAEYPLEGLRDVLERLFGETTLADLRKRVMVPCFDLDDEGGDAEGARAAVRAAADPHRSWKAKFLHNFPGSDSDGEVPVWRAALRTAAAPTYFPSSEGYVDGGVVAANPSVCALAQTQDRRSLADPPPIAEIALLSLGTGRVAQFLPGERHDWGAVQWGRPLVDMVMSGSVDVAAYQCRALLAERFQRVSPQLRRSDRLGLDSHSPRAIARLRAIAASVDLAPTVDWLTRFW